jgi:ketosteroid isomerase-like protein
MPRSFVMICLVAFMTATVVAQNTNSSATGKPRTAGTNTNRSADLPKPKATQQPAPAPPPRATPAPVQTAPARPKVPTAQAPAGTVLAAFERLLNGIRKADVKAVSNVYLNSSSLVLFNNNGTITRGWEQMRKNRESSYPDLKDVKLDVRDLAVTMLGRDGAVVTCFWTQSQVYKDVPETATGRMTLVFKRVGPDWKAVHLHTSPDKPDPSRVLPSEESPSPAPSASPSPSPNP